MQNGGFPAVRSFLRASSWLPPLFIRCGKNKARLLGGFCGGTNEIVVRCHCKACRRRVSLMPDMVPVAKTWADLMTLEVRGCFALPANLSALYI